MYVSWKKEKQGGEVAVQVEEAETRPAGSVPITHKQMVLWKNLITFENDDSKVRSRKAKNWDKWREHLLFTVREVPQASTGFSPFELLYGH